MCRATRTGSFRWHAAESAAVKAEVKGAFLAHEAWHNFVKSRAAVAQWSFRKVDAHALRITSAEVRALTAASGRRDLFSGAQSAEVLGGLWTKRPV